MTTTITFKIHLKDRDTAGRWIVYICEHPRTIELQAIHDVQKQPFFKNGSCSKAPTFM